MGILLCFLLLFVFTTAQEPVGAVVGEKLERDSRFGAQLDLFDTAKLQQQCLYPKSRACVCKREGRHGEVRICEPCRRVVQENGLLKGVDTRCGGGGCTCCPSVSQTVSFSTSPGTRRVEGPTYTPSYTSSTSPVSLSSSTSSVCTVSSGRASFVAAGTCTLRAFAPSNCVYLGASKTQTFTVYKNSQSLTWNSAPSTSTTLSVDSTYSFQATATSGLTVQISGSGACPASKRVIGGPQQRDASGKLVPRASQSIRMASAGTCTIKIEQGGNGKYYSAPVLTRTYTVSKLTNAVTSWSTPSGTIRVTIPQSTGSASAISRSGACSLSVENTFYCTISGGTITFKNAGPCVLKAYEDGNFKYFALPTSGSSVPKRTITINKGLQSISRSSSIGTRYVSGASYLPSVSASSGLGVSVSASGSSTSGACYKSGSRIYFRQAGLVCTVTYSQSGNSNWNGASTITETTTVQKGSHSVSIGTPTTPRRVGETGSVSASSNRGLGVTFTTSTPSFCSVTSSGTITFKLAGTNVCTIIANGASSSNYVSDTDQVTFSITPGPQSITWSGIPGSGAASTGGSTTVSASAPGGTVQISVDSGSSTDCSYNPANGRVSFLGGGLCKLIGYEDGNTHYLEVSDSESFTIVGGSQTLTLTAPISSPVVGGSPVPVTCTSNRGLTPELSTSTPTACSLSGSTSGSTVSFLKAQSCRIVCSQDGNQDWAAAADKTIGPFAIGKGSHSVSFGSAIPTGSLATVRTPNKYTVTASSTRTSSISISSTTTSVCTLDGSGSGSKVTFLAVGNCVLRVTAATLADYVDANPVTQTIPVTRGSHAITFDTSPPADATKDGTTYSVSATASPSGLAAVITVDATATTVCSVTGSGPYTVSFIGGGTCRLNANVAQTTNYLAAPQEQQSFGVSLKPQSITWGTTEPNDATVDGQQYAPEATASSGLQVAITAGPSSKCTIAGGLVRFVGAGTSACTVYANQQGNSEFNAAAQVTQVINIAKGSQVLEFTSAKPLTAKVAGDPYEAAAQSNKAGVSVALTSATTSVCEIDPAGEVTFKAAGQCSLRANSAGNANYGTADEVAQQFNVAKGVQLLTFAAPPTSARVNGSPYSASVSSNAPLAAPTIAVAASSAQFCSISNDVIVNFQGAGQCVLVANSATTTNYAVATAIELSFPVLQGVQTVAFTSGQPASPKVGTTYTPEASATSGLSPSFSVAGASTGICSISAAGIVSFLKVGDCTLSVSAPSDLNWLSATGAPLTITVQPGDQAITFTSPLPTAPVVNGDSWTVAAVSSITNGVTFSRAPSSNGICTLLGTEVSFQAVGECRILANAGATADYAAAPQKPIFFNVGKGLQSISFTSGTPSAVVNGDKYTAAAVSSAGATVTITVPGSSQSYCTINGATSEVSFHKAGTCVLEARAGATTNFLEAPVAELSFSISRGSQTLQFTSDAPTNAYFGGVGYAPSATSTSGLAVALQAALGSSSVCVSSGGLVTFVGAGSCTVVASNGGSVDFVPASSVEQTFNVARANQTVEFTTQPPVGGVQVGGSPYTVAAIASSGLIPQVSVVPASGTVCSLSGDSVSFQAVGSCVLRASQDGDGKTNAAMALTQSIPVAKGTQELTFDTEPPASASVAGQTYTPQASSNAGLPVQLSVDPSATSVCSMTNGVVSFLFLGECKINANQDGSDDWAAASQKQQVFGVGLNAQAITFTSNMPTAAAVGSTYAISATSDSGLVVTFDTDGSTICSVVNTSIVVMQATGNCVVFARQPGNNEYNAAPVVQQSFDVGKGDQTVSFTSTAPGNAKVGETYSVAGTSSVNLPVSFSTSNDALCTVVATGAGATVTFTGAAAPCLVYLDAAESSDYKAAPRKQQSITVAKGTQALEFTSDPPAVAKVGGTTFTPAVASTAGAAVTPVISVAAGSATVCSYSGGIVSFVGAGTCVLNADAPEDGNYLAATRVSLSIPVFKGDPSVSITSGIPSGAMVGGTHQVVATVSSGLAPQFSVDGASQGVCTVSATGVLSFLRSDDCIVSVKRDSDLNWNAAPTVTQTIPVGAGVQTISFESMPPSPARVGGALYPAAATSSVGLTPIVLTVQASSASFCSISAGGQVSFLAVGPCVVVASSAGSSDYQAASATQTISVVKGLQTVEFSVDAPGDSRVGGSSFTVAAVSSVGLTPVTFSSSSSSVCTVSGGTVSFLSIGLCQITANQAGSAQYEAAPQAVLSWNVFRGLQTLTFSSPPSSPVVGGSFTVSATSSTAGLVPVITVDPSSGSACTLEGSTVNFLAASGCTLNANQDGSTQWEPAPQKQLSFAIGKGSQTISWNSNVPVGAKVGGATYTAVATASSGLAVSFTAASASVCSVQGAVVSMIGIGDCTVEARQAGSDDFNSASVVSQTWAVTAGDQVLTFDSIPPANAAQGGASYSVQVSSNAPGASVTVTVDASSSSVCIINNNVVGFTGVGTCLLRANAAATSTFQVAPQASQSFGVGLPPQDITISSPEPTSPKVSGSYTVSATSSSLLPVAYSIDSAASLYCALSGTTVSFVKAGLCIVNFDQEGSASFNTAPRKQQSFLIAKGDQVVSFDSTAPSGARVGDTYTAMASSTVTSLAVQISSNTPTICSVGAGNVVTFIGAASGCVLNANQDGTVDYNAATQAQQPIAVSKGTQTLSFTTAAPVGARVAGAKFQPLAVSTGLGVTPQLTIDAAAAPFCSLSGGEVTFIAAGGNCVINANAPEDANYLAAAQVQLSFAVNPGFHTLDFTSLAPSNAVVNGTRFTPAATASSGLSPTFSIDGAAGTVCRMQGAEVEFIGEGVCSVLANLAATTNYAAAPQISLSFSVGPGVQVLTFTSSTSSAQVIGPVYVPTVTSNANLPVTIEVDSSTSANCVYSTATGAVSFTSQGSCLLRASAPSNKDWQSATKTQSFSVAGGATQTLQFVTAPSAARVAGAASVVTVESSAGLPATIAVAGASSSICSLSGSASGSTLSFARSGDCTVLANAAGDNSYAAAVQVELTVPVGRGTQTLSFTTSAPTNRVLGGAPYVPAASSSAGLTPVISVAAISSGVCTISAGSVSFTSAGSCILVASSSGSADYDPAPNVQQVVAVGRAAQTVSITSTEPAPATVGGSPYQLTGTSSAPGLAPAFTVDASSTPGACIITQSVVYFPGKVGTCVVNANNAGSDNYLPASQVQQSFTVARGSQSLEIQSTAPDGLFVGSTYSVVAIASSGLDVTFAVNNETICNVTSDGVVLGLYEGDCEITCSNAGDANWLAATPVSQTLPFFIDKGSQTFPPAELFNCSTSSRCALVTSSIFQDFFAEEARENAVIKQTETSFGSCPAAPWLSACNIQRIATMFELNEPRVKNLFTLLDDATKKRANCATDDCRKLMDFVIGSYLPVAEAAGSSCNSTECEFYASGQAQLLKQKVANAEPGALASEKQRFNAHIFDETRLIVQRRTLEYAACTDEACRQERVRKVNVTFAINSYVSRARNYGLQLADEQAYRALMDAVTANFTRCALGVCQIPDFNLIFAQKRAFTRYLVLWKERLEALLAARRAARRATCDSPSCTADLDEELAATNRDIYLMSDYLPIEISAAGWALTGFLLVAAVAVGVLGLMWKTFRGKEVFFVILGGVVVTEVLRLAFWSVAYMGYGTISLTFVLLDKISQLMFALTILLWVFLWARACLILWDAPSYAQYVLGAILSVVALTITIVSIYYGVSISRDYVASFYGAYVRDLAEVILACFTFAVIVALFVLILFVGCKLGGLRETNSDFANASVSTASNTKRKVEMQSKVDEKLKNLRLIAIGVGLMVAFLAMRLVLVLMRNFATLSFGYVAFFLAASLIPEFFCLTIVTLLVLFTFYQSRQTSYGGGSSNRLTTNSTYQSGASVTSESSNATEMSNLRYDV